MAMHKKPFTVDVDDDVSEAFSDQIEVRGYIKYRAIEGALRAFMALPPELQVQLMNNNVSDVSHLIKEKLLDADLVSRLGKLTSEQRNQLVALAKEGAKVLSRKN